jgi:hypothetical protein
MSKSCRHRKRVQAVSRKSHKPLRCLFDTFLSYIRFKSGRPARNWLCFIVSRRPEYCLKLLSYKDLHEFPSCKLALFFQTSAGGTPDLLSFFLFTSAFLENWPIRLRSWHALIGFVFT